MSVLAAEPLAPVQVDWPYWPPLQMTMSFQDIHLLNVNAKEAQLLDGETSLTVEQHMPQS